MRDLDKRPTFKCLLERAPKSRRYDYRVVVATEVHQANRCERIAHDERTVEVYSTIRMCKARVRSNAINVSLPARCSRSRSLHKVHAFASLWRARDGLKGRRWG